MGRIQMFETVSVVRAARDVFWDKGFEATSVADLEEATGLRRNSTPTKSGARFTSTR